MGHMLPYGKPPEVGVTIYHYDDAGRLMWSAQSVPGLPDVGRVDMDTKVDPVTRTKDFHHETCQGVRGVTDTFWRDGRHWCTGCYSLKYGANPWLEPENWGKKIALDQAPLTVAQRMKGSGS